MSTADKGWSFEEACAAQERAVDADPEMENLPSAPVYQWVALHELDELERQFQRGDDFALMEAICKCAMHDLLMPEWVQRGYIDRFRKVQHCQTASWDEAFGRPYPKYFHLDAARNRRQLRPRVYNRIREIQKTEPKTPTDEYLFERVGAEFGIGSTLASKLYYEMKPND